MFLIRAAFWLALVILLLPADPKSGEQAPSVGAIEALLAARAAVADLSAFCDRNADVCATGSSALKVFTQKVRYGVHMFEDYFDRDSGDTNSDTLKGDDSAPSLQGSTPGDRSA